MARERKSSLQLCEEKLALLEAKIDKKTKELAELKKEKKELSDSLEKLKLEALTRLIDEKGLTIVQVMELIKKAPLRSEMGITAEMEESR